VSYSTLKNRVSQKQPSGTCGHHHHRALVSVHFPLAPDQIELQQFDCLQVEESTVMQQGAQVRRLQNKAVEWYEWFMRASLPKS
jgi:hypothetical protein